MRAIIEIRALLIIIIILSITALYGCSGDKGDTIYTTSYDAPGTPADIQAVAGDEEVTVRWSPVSGAISYNIYWNTAGGVTTSDEVIGTATTYFEHPGLTNETTYYYAVTAVNMEGESPVSSEASATPVDSSTSNPPSVPAGVTATAGDGQVTINWSPVSGATSYNIYWNTTGSVTTSDRAIISAPSPYVHMNLINGTRYYYAVTAINNDRESGLSTEASAAPVTSGGDTGTPPSAPANVQATPGDGQVAVTWSPVAGATSYNIYWNTTGSVTTSDDVIGTSTSLLLHPNLANGTTYYYAVTAVNTDGESSLSSVASATPVASGGTGTPPSSPTGVNAIGGDNQIAISWDPVEGALAYNVYWNITGSVTTADEGIGTSTTLFAHPGLTNGITYYYAVSAINAYGESSPSAEVSAMPGLPFTHARQKLFASDAGTNDWFGQSVSISGDYAIVGASSNNSAYIYHQTGPDMWDTGIKIISSDLQPGDNFGASVSMDGDYAIVGAPDEDAGGTNAGAAYIFHRTGTNTWDGGTKIMAFDPAGSDWFGVSVSISGDYAIVGAYGESDGGPQAGAAYIFHRTGTNTWDTGTKIVAFDAEVSDWFGFGVSISGNYAIAGAQYENTAAYHAGAVYIYRRTGTNTWDAGTKIVAPDAQSNDIFGARVSISGNYAIAGAIWENGGAGDPLPGAGAAYIFRRTGTNTWDAGTKIVAPDAHSNYIFGFSVSIYGDTAMVGARFGGPGGGAYIYHRTGTNTWDAGTKIVAPDAQSNDEFGCSVSISGDYAIVGARSEDGGAGDPISNAGAAYIY